MNRREQYLALAAAMCCTACNGIGRPLVDTVPGGIASSTSIPPEITCSTLLRCPSQQPPLTVRGGSLPSLPSTCTAGPVQELDLAQLIARGGCQCEQLRLVLAPAENVLRDLTIQDCSLQIAATLATSLRMERISIRNSSLALAGPLRVALADLVALEGVVLRSDGDVSQTAQFQIEQTQAQDLSVEQVELSIVRSSVQDCSLSLSRLTTESSHLLECSVNVGSIAAIDSHLERVTLAVQNGSMAASRASELLLSSCDTFLFAGGNVEQSELHSCRSLLRLYGASVQSSMLDGTVESDSSSFMEVSFGVGEPAQLTAWESQIANSAFCQGSGQLRLSSGTVSCSVCEGALQTSSADACQDDQGEVGLVLNACPGLQTLPTCSEAFPVSERR